MSMETRFRITESQIKHLIKEVYRKMSLLNESVREGGKAGHMLNVFEIDDLTFGDYKELVNRLFSTGIEHITEKLDGMNVFATVNMNGEVKFARNASHVRDENAGMGIEDMEARWAGDESKGVLDAYKNAYYLFSDAVAKLPDARMFFNPGKGYKLYANCEVLDKNHPNAVPYANTCLSVHNLKLYDPNNEDVTDEFANTQEYTQRMELLRKVLPTVESQYGAAQVTPEVVIEIREDNNEVLEKFLTEIDNIELLARGSSDDTTLIQYREIMLFQYLQATGHEILLDNEFTETFIQRWVYGVKKPTIVQLRKLILTSGVENAEQVFNAAYEFEKNELPEVMKKIMEPVENFVYRLGNEVISRCQGLANQGNEEKTIANLVAQLEATKEEVRQSGDLELQKEMAYWLNRLSQIDFKYNATEGIVFTYKGRMMKLTGSFASLNRAIHIMWHRKKKNQD